VFIVAFAFLASDTTPKTLEDSTMYNQEQKVDSTPHQTLSSAASNATQSKADEANARLISAAPELLEALESIAEYWNQDRNDQAMHDACWHAIETARAAIARAKGETK
jgi:type VI protein secretion system component VasF